MSEAESDGKELRIGFIGCGDHATNCLYPSLRMAPIDLVAVCDLDEERRSYNARHFGATRAYADHREMLDKEELDAIFIVTGPKFHPVLAMEAMERGLHVWMEKPPALDAATALKILAVSRKTGRQAGVGFMKRYATAYRMAKEITERPDFGEPVMLHSNFASGSYGSVEVFVNDFPVHHLDLARFYMGEVTSLTAFQARNTGDEAAFSVVLNFANGSVASCNFTSLHGWGNPTERIEIVGRNQYVIVDNVHRLTHYRNAPEAWEERERLDPANDAVVWEPNWLIPDTTNSSLYHTGYINEVRAFARSILAGEPFSPDIADGVRALEMIEAIQESQGTPIQLGQ